MSEVPWSSAFMTVGLVWAGVAMMWVMALSKKGKTDE